MISIVVPSRNRPGNIARLLKSLKNVSNDFNKLDIIIRLDKDDKDLEGYIKETKKYINIQVKIDNKRENLSDLWDECYHLTKYPLIMMCADDVIFRTKDWDKKITNRLKNPERTLYLSWCDDKNQGKNMPTLPILSKAWVEAVGYFVPKGYVCDFCDVHIQNIAEKLERFGIKVMWYHKDIVVEHMHPTVNKGKWDKVYTSRRNKRDKAGQVYSKRAIERSNKAKKLCKMVKSGSLDSINKKAKK